MRYFRQNDRTNWSGVVTKSIQKLTTRKLERDGRTSEAGWVWKRFAYIQEEKLMDLHLNGRVTGLRNE